jgi:hypothetical protein
MAMRLGEEDGRAVDLVLDRGSMEPGQPASVYVQPGTDGLERRVTNVENILKVLAQMPAADPPSDLVGRTMQRIDQAKVNSASSQPRPYVPPQQGQDRHHA